MNLIQRFNGMIWSLLGERTINIIIDKFEGICKKQSFPNGFWDNKISHKLYMLILRIKLEFYKIESLYKISQNDLKKNHGGGGFLQHNKYNNSTNLILYPKHENLRMFGSFKGLTPNGNLKIKCWSKTNVKQPHEVALQCNDKFEFICDACSHSFSVPLSNIVSQNRWCPYCANLKRCDDTLSCKTCLAKTFHSFEGKTSSGTLKVECWSKTNVKQPHEVALQCNGKFEFNCDECHHPFNSRISNIVSLDRWCPYCAKPSKKLCDDTLSCQSCLKKTFHSFDGKTPNGNKVLDCWAEDNPKKPHEVFMCSDKKYKFNCDSCYHSFDTSLSHVVGKRWCPTCKNKTEKVVLEFTQNLFSKKDVKHQFKHEKVKNIRELPFDICILPHQIIIEVDGRQHFQNVSQFKSNTVEQCERDCKKMKIIFEEGYCVIRIVQEDIWSPKTREEVLTKLEKAIQECIHHELPMIHYISVDDSMYDNHKRITESYPHGETKAI
jgi:very-short-patch-repair endonuclease